MVEDYFGRLSAVLEEGSPSQQYLLLHPATTAWSMMGDSTGAVIAKVASTPGAIGYASLDALDDSVKALSLEGVEATAENIKAGNYFLSRPFVMATKGEISEQNDLVQAWFDFVLGDEGQQVASEVGLITVK